MIDGNHIQFSHRVVSFVSTTCAMLMCALGSAAIALASIEFFAR